VTPRSGNTSRHTRNPRGEGDRLRQDLTTAANRLLENGATHESLSLRAVAREVGIAATSIYLHFPDKATLLLAVYQRHFADLAHYLDEAIAQRTDPAARLHAAAAAYCQFAADHPEAYHVLFTVPGGANPRGGMLDGQRPGTGVIGAIQRVITECIDACLIHPTDPYEATLCLWAGIHGLITLRAARPQIQWPPLETLIDTLMRTYLCPAQPGAAAV
jgi:AcrR family transcriptional regulator